MIDIYKDRYCVVFDDPALEIHKTNLQLLAFELGFSWASKDAKVLYTDAGEMRALFFNTVNSKELTRSISSGAIDPACEEVSVAFLANRFKELLNND